MTLLGSAAASAALSVYQWHELFTVRAGGTTACSINETVNCAAVWNSAFASRVHDWFGMPVAGLGLVWSLSALVLAGLLLWRTRQGAQWAPLGAAVKVWALGGVLTCITLATVSALTGALCLTCLGTYALVGANAFAALVLLPKPVLPTDRLVSAVAWSVVVAVPVFLAMLWPGQRTPKSVGEPAAKIEPSQNDGRVSEADIAQYLQNMSEPEKQATAYARQTWLSGTTHDVSGFTTRERWGPPNAPVAVVDFTDVLCGHCRQFEQMASELKKILPAGTLSVESRYFPLDGECNSKIEKVWGNGVRCLGAKVQLCLEGTPALAQVKHELFTRQESLTKELVLDIASRASGQAPDQLLACVTAPATQAKLDEDIRYATMFGITGTPLVLVNGKETPPVGTFLLALALSRGDANSPFFQALPPPPPLPQ